MQMPVIKDLTTYSGLGASKVIIYGKKHLSTSNVNIWSTVSHSMSMVITALPVVHWTSQMFYRRVMTPVHDPVRLSLRLYWTCALIFSLIFHSSENGSYCLMSEHNTTLSCLCSKRLCFYSFIHMIIYFQIVHKQVQSDIDVIVWKTEGRAF